MRIIPIVLLILASASPATGADPEPLPSGQPDRAPSQVVLEIGVALPQGDLGADFHDDPLGFGAGNGFEVGFRWRFHLSPHLSLAPSFAFTNFADHDDFRFDLDENEMVAADTKASVFGYGLEARYAAGTPGDFLCPFVGLEAGLQRMRVAGWQKDFAEPIDRAVNGLGIAARAGLRVDQFELSLVYRLTRFGTRQYFASGSEQDYSWDTLVVRLGWIIPL